MEESVCGGKCGGFGLAWKEWDHGDASGVLDLHLVVDDVPIEGGLWMQKGTGLRGVNVMVEMVWRSWWRHPGRLSILRTFDGFNCSCPRRFGRLRSAAVVTDEAGRFTLRGIGRDRHVFLHVHGGGAAYERIEAVTRVAQTEARDLPDSPLEWIPCIRP